MSSNVSSITETKIVPKTPKLPSISEVDRYLKERLPGLRLYNPTDEWVELEVHGIPRFAPPDLDGAYSIHPVTGEEIPCSGEFEIKGRFLTQKDSSRKVIEGQDAASVVKFVVQKETYGQMGFCWLPGISQEEDDKLKEASKAVWLDYQRQGDIAIIERRAAFKANWDKNPNHRGEPCPPPTESETSAMERQQERRARKSFKYNCEVENCPGFGVNEWDRFSRHMKTAHGITVSREKFDGEVSGLGNTKKIETKPEEDPSSTIKEAAADLTKKLPKSK